MDTARMPNKIGEEDHCSLTSGLFMEIALLASMEFADGALSEKRGMILKSFPGFDLFRHILPVQSG